MFASILRLPRSVLLSVLVIAAAAAVVSGAAYAGFTDSGNASGTVSAGTLDILLDDSDNAVVIFSTGVGCPGNMAPGDTCSTTVTVTNGTGSLAFDYTLGTPVVTVNLTACTGFSAVAGPLFDSAGLAGHMPSGVADEETFVIDVILAGDTGNECQGATASVVVTVSAVQDANPHTTVDSH